jgi:enoyl-CoA hydratase/carnithine racemase
MDHDILFERRGAIGLVTLNRPKALNALTQAMCVSMRSQLDEWASDGKIEAVVVQGAGDRAFCAGGDIRSLYESGRAGTPYARDFYRDEYLLDATIKHYRKPYIALISGIVMGGGVGVSVNGRFRVADETTTFAMPETGIGLFPDVGGSYFLPRIHDGPEMGMYLALTGTRLTVADVYQQGIATNFVAHKNRDALIERLADGAAAESVFKALATLMPDTFAPNHREEIKRDFSASSVEGVLAALDAESGDWASETAANIRKKSPTSTKLAFRQLREGAKLEFDDCMRMEFRMVNRIIKGHDFYEGVRATIIDKDNQPKWRPADISSVSDEEIDVYFAPLGDDELPL